MPSEKLRAWTEQQPVGSEARAMGELALRDRLSKDSVSDHVEKKSPSGFSKLRSKLPKRLKAPKVFHRSRRGSGHVGEPSKTPAARREGAVEDPSPEALVQQLYDRFPRFVALSKVSLASRENQTKEAVLQEGLKALADDIAQDFQRTGALPLREISGLLSGLAAEPEGRKLMARTGLGLDRNPTLREIAGACSDVDVGGLLNACISIDERGVQHRVRQGNIQRVKDHLGPDDRLNPRPGAGFVVDVFERVGQVWEKQANVIRSQNSELADNLDALVVACSNSSLHLELNSDIAKNLGDITKQLRSVVDRMGSAHPDHTAVSQLHRFLYILTDAMKPEGQVELADYQSRHDTNHVEAHAYRALQAAGAVADGQKEAAFAFALDALGCTPGEFEGLVERAPRLDDAARTAAQAVIMRSTAPEQGR